MKNLSIVIPIYKEKKNIVELTNKIKKNLNFKNYEIIFVDDNSEDGTQEILKNLKKKYKNFNFIIRKKKERFNSIMF